MATTEVAMATTEGAMADVRSQQALASHTRRQHDSAALAPRPIIEKQMGTILETQLRTTLEKQLGIILGKQLGSGGKEERGGEN
jgi:uncharacterized lipoprotein YajG